MENSQVLVLHSTAEERRCGLFRSGGPFLVAHLAQVDQEA